MDTASECENGAVDVELEIEDAHVFFVVQLGSVGRLGELQLCWWRRLGDLSAVPPTCGRERATLVEAW